MGFSVRKRTKGKDSWLNLSYSKRGLHASHTMRFGNLTLNFGKKLRTTVNLGNGMRYVKTHSKKKPSTAKPKPYKTSNTSYSSSAANVAYVEEGLTSENIAMMSGVLWCLFGFAFAYFLSSILLTVIVVQLAHVTTLWLKRSKYPQDTLFYFTPLLIMITPVGWVYLLLLLLVV